MKKKLGIGSFALVLVLMAILWSCNLNVTSSKICLGDLVLTRLGFPAWSNGSVGTYYTVFWGLLLYLPAFLLGRKYEHHLFARSGKWISGCLGGCLIIMGCAFMIWS